MEHLTEEDRAKIGTMTEMVIETISKRYGVTVSEAVEAIKWVHDHKEFVAKMKHSSIFAVIGVLLSAMLLALWEGARTLLHGGPK